MRTIEHSVDIVAPVANVFSQWVEFDTMPRFAAGVEEVRRIDDRHQHWSADIAGKHQEWDAEIIEEIPDRRIAWRSTSGAAHSGTVTVEPVSQNSSRLTLRLSYEPHGIAEKLGGLLGILDSYVVHDLERFKQWVEEGGEERPALPLPEELVGQ